jgi:FkbM family methyltransferase
MSKFTRKLARSIGHRLGRLLSFEHAALVSEAILETKGFGGGSHVQSSGEMSIFKLLSDAPIVLDVGGHVGEYAEACLRARPAGRIFVFEPSESHFRILQSRLGGKSEVTLEKIGLGARSCELPLYKTGEVSGLASLTRRRLDHFGVVMDVVESVVIKTLDEIVAQHGIETIDLLKIDVEGHELDVLNGATKAFGDNRIKMVQFEFGGCNLDTRTTLQDFFYFFQDRGFTMALLQPSGKLQPLPRYYEFLEQYRTTNFLAASRSVAATLEPWKGAARAR